MGGVSLTLRSRNIRRPPPWSSKIETSPVPPPAFRWSFPPRFGRPPRVSRCTCRSCRPSCCNSNPYRIGRTSHFLRDWCSYSRTRRCRGGKGEGRVLSHRDAVLHRRNSGFFRAGFYDPAKSGGFWFDIIDRPRTCTSNTKRCRVRQQNTPRRNRHKWKRPCSCCAALPNNSWSQVVWCRRGG